MPNYESVIGLETHIQLNTKSKIFCGCKADSWDDLANKNICPICVGLPGVLPSLNKSVVEKAVLLALAVEADSIQPISYLERKNYFYPDLPKGFQISQYAEPLARGGRLIIPSADGDDRLVNIQKLHIEEDAGKTVHQNGKRLIDFNRCGIPLVEMVTDPDIRSADEAAAYLIRLRVLLRWLGISEADMERGQLRCDANVSIRMLGEDSLNPKTEIKNINSIENVRAAIKTEIKRQIQVVEAGQTIKAWTLGWDEDTETLRKMRSKETEADYRYFREPDLLPIRIDEEWLAAIKSSLPELPLARRKRFSLDYGLPDYDAVILTEERSLSSYFEATVNLGGADPKTISNWVMNDVLRLIKETKVPAAGLHLIPKYLAEIIEMVESGTITRGTGKDLLIKVEDTGKPPMELVEFEGLGQVSDDETLKTLAMTIVTQNPKQVATYKAGKTTILGWFVGQLMRETKGRADAKLVQSIFQELLNNA